MMINKDFKLTSSENFITMPWRNGLGTTIELLKKVTPGDERFAYRLSMATVNEDGPFSNFDGYSRTLVLLEGTGITLRYESDRSAVLEQPLQMASFDGGEATTATLHDGPIVDFNIMVRGDSYHAQTTCSPDSTPVTIEPASNCLAVYAIEDGLQLLSDNGEKAIQIPSGALLHSVRPLQGSVTLEGASFIAVEIFST